MLVLSAAAGGGTHTDLLVVLGAAGGEVVTVPVGQYDPRAFDVDVKRREVGGRHLMPYTTNSKTQRGTTS